MLWLDKKYVNLLSSSLRNFKWRDSRVANFSCPVCGDSTNNPKKARGYLYVVRDSKTNQEAFVFHCHKCGLTKPFGLFLQTVNLGLYDEYKMERLKEKYSGKKAPQANVEVFKETPKPTRKASHLTPVVSLPATHVASVYLAQRRLPKDRVLWTDTFADVVRELAPDYKLKIKNEPRLCLMLKDPAGDVVGIVGRSLQSSTNDKYRYLTIKFDKDAPKLFGLEQHSREKPTFVVEGPLDSLLLPNSIAMCGGSVSFEILDQYFDKEHTFVALDNEPRKVQTVQKMMKFVEHGYKIVVWSGVSSKYKDINDMMLKGGMSRRDVLRHIAQHSFTKLAAENEINAWKKCKL